MRKLDWINMIMLFVLKLLYLLLFSFSLSLSYQLLHTHVTLGLSSRMKLKFEIELTKTQLTTALLCNKTTSLTICDWWVSLMRAALPTLLWWLMNGELVTCRWFDFFIKCIFNSIHTITITLNLFTHWLYIPFHSFFYVFSISIHQMHKYVDLF